jgi:hypothetical protein
MMIFTPCRRQLADAPAGSWAYYSPSLVCWVAAHALQPVETALVAVSGRFPVDTPSKLSIYP